METRHLGKAKIEGQSKVRLRKKPKPPCGRRSKRGKKILRRKAEKASEKRVSCVKIIKKRRFSDKKFYEKIS